MITTGSKQKSWPNWAVKRNPLILRVADDSKVDMIANTCHENGWHFILGFEPDKEEDLTDLERKLSPPIHHEAAKIGAK